MNVLMCTANASSSNCPHPFLTSIEKNCHEMIQLFATEQLPLPTFCTQHEL